MVCAENSGTDAAYINQELRIGPTVRGTAENERVGGTRALAEGAKRASVADADAHTVARSGATIASRRAYSEGPGSDLCNGRKRGDRARRKHF